MAAQDVSLAVAESGVERLVRSAARSLRAVHALESVLCGAAAALLVLAAGVHSGAALRDVNASGVASLTGLTAAASWYAERKHGAARVARELDAALGQQGALATAYEHARSNEPIARALEARVMASVGQARARRALLPSPWLVAPAPFLAGALLALALEGRALELRPTELARLHVQIASALDEARAEAVALGSAQASALVELAQRAQALNESAAPAPAELARIEAELSAALARERQPAALERALAKARNAAQAALEREREAASARASAAAALESSASATSAGSTSATAPLAPSASSSSVDARWWPASYDGIVAAWVEAQRDASAPQAGTAPPSRPETKDSRP
jgi:hypothetical protein